MILQLHPTLQCNLRCLHCYSSSGPGVQQTLDTELALDVVTDAAQIGYNILSISGGEPLVYRDLLRILSHARSCGMKTQIVTNGMLLTTRRIREFEPVLDLLAISLDGPPTLHNEVRQSPRAFGRMASHMADLKNSSIKFGIIYTLTRRSAEFLPWAADFAFLNRASLFQIHPLELFGRAKSLMAHDKSDEESLAKAYIAAFIFRDRYPGMQIQIDLVHRDTIIAQGRIVYGVVSSDASVNGAGGLGEQFSPLVVQADGSVVPMAHGFSKEYEVCNLRFERLITRWPTYLNGGGFDRFRRLVDEACGTLTMMRSQIPLVNWHEWIGKWSHARRPSTAHLQEAATS